MEANGNLGPGGERQEEGLREDRPLGPYPLKRHLKSIRNPEGDRRIDHEGGYCLTTEDCQGVEPDVSVVLCGTRRGDKTTGCDLGSGGLGYPEEWQGQVVGLDLTNLLKYSPV